MTFSFGNIINFLNSAAPKGLINSAEEWIKQRARSDDRRHPQPAAWCKGFSDAREIITHDSCSEAMDGHPNASAVRWSAASESKLFYLSEVRVLGAEGAVISPDNLVFREFSFPPDGSPSWSHHSCFKRRRIPPIKELNGWYATITYPNSRFYYHWMIEALPRMRLLADYTDILDGIIVPGNRSPFHEQSLKALGIPSCKLIPVGPNSHYKVRHLFVPKYYAFSPPAWLTQWFKTHFLEDRCRVTSKTYRRIYVSRGDATARRVTNESEVISLLESLGFESFTLSKMSFVEQARLFSDADIVVAPHGAALANLVFSRPETQVLEFFTPDWAPPCYYTLARSGRLRYSYLIAHQTSEMPELPKLADMTVPIDTLRHSVLRLIE